MEASFEELINSYIETHVGISGNFLPDALAANLTANLLELYNENMMAPAGTGNSGKVAFDKKIAAILFTGWIKETIIKIKMIFFHTWMLLLIILTSNVIPE